MCCAGSILPVSLFLHLRRVHLFVCSAARVRLAFDELTALFLHRSLKQQQQTATAADADGAATALRSHAVVGGTGAHTASLRRLLPFALTPCQVRLFRTLYHHYSSPFLPHLSMLCCVYCVFCVVWGVRRRRWRRSTRTWRRPGACGAWCRATWGLARPSWPCWRSSAPWRTATTKVLPGFSPSFNSDAHNSSQLSLSLIHVIVVGALLAPTEILAKQHYHTISRHFRDLHGAPDTATAADTTHARRRPFRVELITGAVKGRAREQLLTDLAAGDIDVLVGTHALLTDNVAGAFKRLGLVVIDEVPYLNNWVFINDSFCAAL